ncbi:MAG: GxxExxY protein [Bacteroidota bacterium]
MEWTKKKINELAYEIVGCAIAVHRELGSGLLESVYEICMEHELKLSGLEVKRQQPVKINYRGVLVEKELRYDLLVEDCIVVELKSAEIVHPVHESVLMTYMRLLEKPKGLLINFFTDNITKSLKPFVNDIFAELPDR